MIKRFFIPFLIVTFLVACNKTKEEVIDLNDIITESDRYKEGEQETVVEDVIFDSTKILLQSFLENGIDAKSLTIVEKNAFPDRFGPENSDKYVIEKELDTMFYFNWRFIDSAKTINAFFNWIDNFGEKRKSIFIGEEKNLQKEPFLLFVGDTSLIFIQAQESLYKKEWEHFFDAKGYAKDWNYVLQQRKWGKVKWD